MAFLWQYTETDFEQNYEIDLGDGVRASYISSDKKATQNGGGDFPVGIMFAHPNGDGYCAGTIFWDKPFEAYDGPIWELQNLDPLTLNPSILCDCGLHGYIKDGKWVNVD